MGLKLVGEVALDGSGFERGLSRLGDSVKGFIATAFGVYGVAEAFRHTFEEADRLTTASDRLGVGVEQLQVLQKAAKDAGSDLGSVTKSFEKIDQARAKALSGSKEGMKLLSQFGRLGISEGDLRTQSAADLFTGKISKASNTMNQEDLGPILRDILGKGFGEAMPVLQTDFDELGRHMKDMGAIMDEEVARKLDAIGDEFSILSKIMTSQLAPGLLKMVEVLSRGVLELGKMLAGGAASFGAATAKQGTWDTIKSAFTIGTVGLRGAFMENVLGMPHEDVQKWANSKLDQTGMDPLAGNAARVEAENPWQKGLDAFQKLLDDAAAKATAKRAKPAFEVPDDSGMPKQRRAKLSEDALTKVGNFLGASGRSVMEDIGRQQLDVLNKIADNTNPNNSGGSGFSDDDF